MDYFRRRIDILIAQQWVKQCKNASDAHFRAQELTRLQEIKEKHVYENNRKNN